ncbi:MAG: hypothetical protein HY225_02700 [Candidatus Vogelbacteria bacterium]|nr:hypothetical protein [Candidatus Vogelbacteria bacterium]
MLYLFFGGDRDKVLARSNEVINRTTSSLPDILFARIDADSFEKAKFEELVGGRSLFAKKIVVLCDGLFTNKEIGSFLSKKVEGVAESPNVFIFRDMGIDKKILDLLKKIGANIEEIELPESEKGYAGAREVRLKAGYESFNIFSFTDAIGGRDKKAAWVLFHKALRAGFPVEELLWKAVWIFKNIILASPAGGDQKEVTSKLKVGPFVLNKARGFVGKYNQRQLLAKYRGLVDVYHGTRRGIVDTEMALEQFILNL